MEEGGAGGVGSVRCRCPENPLLLKGLGLVLYQRYNSGVNSDPALPETPFRASSEGLLLAVKGDRDRSLALLSDEVRNWAWKASEWAQAVGDWCAEAGAQEEALRWLERSRQNGFINHRFVAEHDPHLEPLRGRPDFRRYLERVRADLEEFEAGLEPVPG